MIPSSVTRTSLACNPLTYLPSSSVTVKVTVTISTSTRKWLGTRTSERTHIALVTQLVTNNTTVTIVFTPVNVLALYVLSCLVIHTVRRLFFPNTFGP